MSALMPIGQGFSRSTLFAKGPEQCCTTQSNKRCVLKTGHDGWHHQLLGLPFRGSVLRQVRPALFGHCVDHGVVPAWASTLQEALFYCPVDGCQILFSRQACWTVREAIDDGRLGGGGVVDKWLTDYLSFCADHDLPVINDVVDVLRSSTGTGGWEQLEAVQHAMNAFDRPGHRPFAARTVESPNADELMRAAIPRCNLTEEVLQEAIDQAKPGKFVPITDEALDVFEVPGAQRELVRAVHEEHERRTKEALGPQRTKRGVDVANHVLRRPQVCLNQASSPSPWESGRRYMTDGDVETAFAGVVLRLPDPAVVEHEAEQEAVVRQRTKAARQLLKDPVVANDTLRADNDEPDPFAPPRRDELNRRLYGTPWTR